jgi:DNA repair photolyase
MAHARTSDAHIRAPRSTASHRAHDAARALRFRILFGKYASPQCLVSSHLFLTMTDFALTSETDARPGPSAGGAGAWVSLGGQTDIRYYAARPRGVLNPPERTGMPYWSVNPYVGCALGCAYCYARYAHRYAAERAGGMPDEGRAVAPGGVMPDDVPDDVPDDAPLPAWLAFERRVLVKREAPALLRRALARPAAHGRLVAGDECVVIGTATDPYQPAERRFRVTRGVLEVLAEREGMRVVIITKSPLVTRDVDVLGAIARRSSLTVHVSLVTLDRDLARRIEPRAPTPEARLRAVRRLSDAGIDVGVNVMPVLPGLTDAPAALDALLERVAAAGATHAGACALRLRSQARDRYLPLIAREFPALAASYRRAYARDHELGRGYRDGLARCFARLCARHGVRCTEYRRPTPAGPNAGVGDAHDDVQDDVQDAGQNDARDGDARTAFALAQLSLGL